MAVTGTLALAGFLEARYAEDEAAARRFINPTAIVNENPTVITGNTAFRDPVPVAPRYDPARVLADVAAKRAIVALMAHAASKCSEDDWPDDGDMSWAALSDMGRHVLLLLVQPYSSHPDFRAEWSA